MNMCHGVTLLLIAGLLPSSQEKTDDPKRKTPELEALNKLKPAVVVIREADEADEAKRKTRGVGLIIDPDGTIVTGHQVIDHTNKIDIVLGDGRKLSAKKLFSDAEWNLAVLKVEAGKPLPAIELAIAGNIEIGDSVVGFGWQGVSKGAFRSIVSGKGRKVKDFDNLYQIDSPIGPGIPSGPVFSLQSKWIGNDLDLLPQNIHFVIPSESVKKRIDDWAKTKPKN